MSYDNSDETHIMVSLFKIFLFFLCLTLSLSINCRPAQTQRTLSSGLQLLKQQLSPIPTISSVESLTNLTPLVVPQAVKSITIAHSLTANLDSPLSKGVQVDIEGEEVEPVTPTPNTNLNKTYLPLIREERDRENDVPTIVDEIQKNLAIEITSSPPTLLPPKIIATPSPPRPHRLSNVDYPKPTLLDNIRQWIVPKPHPAAFIPYPTPDPMPRATRIPILMYHYLSIPPEDSDIYRQDLSVSPGLFVEHLNLLWNEGYETISLYELLNHLTIGAPLPDKPVILTFDDGYRDNYEYAFPLLLRWGMDATFFVVTDFIDEANPRYVSWDMLRTMYTAGMSIEAHSRNHASLKNRDVPFLGWQARTLERFQEELGTRPRFISYPAGEYDGLTISVFHNSNYWGGVTTVQGAEHRNDRLFELKRVRVRGTTSAEDLKRLLEIEW